MNSMATTGDLEITAASSSSSQPSSWDVFLSFYGKDTRRSFTSHLYTALDDAGILTFRDEPALEKGEEISSGLLNVIHSSKMFVIVISENYARSRWCLDELVQILSCNKRKNRVVPVFYHVDPSDLRYQKRSFGEAFEAHKKHYPDDMIHMWKSALAQIAELSGHHLRIDGNEYESEIIQKIVANVAQASRKVLDLEEHLFGIDSAVEEIHQKLRMESDDVRAIGICGMGGIGKTTTAKAFYNKYSNTFDLSCFIDNVQQYSHGGSPLLPLLQKSITGLLKKKDCEVTDVATGIRQLKRILFSKKALVVLDDLDQSGLLNYLVRIHNVFSVGSRIIITTRDVNLLNQFKIDLSEVDIYMVKELGQIDSLKLFSHHAFGKPAPTASLKQLSLSFVTHAGGLPLALKVLGSLLRGRTQVSFWKEKLEEVRKIPVNDIQRILQVSYNDLSEMHKAIFLDIAFFFVGKHSFEADEIFQSCGFVPEVGIPILVERCLLTIDKKGIFQMHNLLQDMGRDLGKSTRLSWQGNTWNDLQNHEGIDKVEGLILNLSQSTEKQINSRIFEKMPKLRLLEIINACGIKGHFKTSFHELRSFNWSYCPWMQLPFEFQPQKLVHLHMPNSNFNILWNGAKPLKSLKFINLNNSVNLKMTPDFQNSKLIERLDIGGCQSLLKLHPSIRDLTRLYDLDLGGCTNLKEFPEPVGQSTIFGHSFWFSSVKGLPVPMKQWANMGYLWLDHCSNLRQLPKQLGDMKLLEWLDASHTAIEELPDSITQLKKLVALDLSNCKNLRKLPQDIGNMEGLENFSACNTAIERLPDSFVGLISLVHLDLRYCQNLRNLPNGIWKLTLLQVLYLSECLKLERLPERLGKMRSLELLDASHTAIESVPDSIGLLSRLQQLSLSYCENLKYVPDSVWNLTSLTDLYLLQAYIGRTNIPKTVKLTKLVNLSLNCDIRLWLPVILSFSSLQQLYLHDEGESLSLTKPFSLSKLYNLQLLQLHCTSFGSSFPELPLSLTHLCLCNNVTLVHLPNLSSLKQLKILDIIGYLSLKSLPRLPPHLQSLMVYNCRSLQNLSDMSMLKELVFLSFGRWSILKSVGLNQSFLQIAEWFSYRSSGRTLCFDIPLLLEDNFLGLALWVTFTSKNNHNFSIRAVVTNKTNGITKYCRIPVVCNSGADGYSLVRCTNGDEILIRSRDSINIWFERQLYSFDGDVEVNYEEVKLEMCAAHVIQKSTITPNFPSVLNNLMDGA